MNSPLNNKKFVAYEDWVLEQIQSNTIEVAPADWNQNDETAPDYIKNRTHWRQAVDGPIVDTDLDFTTENIVYFSQEDANRIFNMRQDVVYQVMINDTIVYQNSIVFDEKGKGIIFDNFLPIDTSYGFMLLISPKDNFVRLSHNKIKGTEYAGVYHFTLKVAGDYIYNPIDSNYLPAALGHSTSAEGWAFHRYGENEALGKGSVAGGNHTKATGAGSFAFGILTEASGSYSIAAGGNTKANGVSSVAIGTYTTANGYGQTALGRYNLIDETAPNSGVYGKYAYIIGNGTADKARSNAHTLDWDGLGWFAGGLKVGGTGQDDENAKEVALKEDIPSIEGLATESYVDTQLAALVNSAPDKLNTLDELAAALGDDENFAATVTGQIADKVSKSELDSVIESALTTAKESGEFDGEDGYSPVRGTDYWTDTDKAEIIEEVKTAVPAQIPAYTEADYGKMLTPTADGLVWTDPPQGGGGSGEAIPSAEGVEF